MIVKFLASQSEIDGDGVGNLHADFQRFCEALHPFHRARWFHVGFSSLFLSFFLLDTAGDAVGWRSSLWAPVLMWTLPLPISIMIDHLTSRYRINTKAIRFSSSAADVELSSAATFETGPQVKTSPSDDYDSKDPGKQLSLSSEPCDFIPPAFDNETRLSGSQSQMSSTLLGHSR